MKLDDSKILVGDLTHYEIVPDEEPDSNQAKSEVVLFVDNREKRNNQDGNYLYDRIVRSGVKVELKSLALGDFLWVLRVYQNQDQKVPIDPKSKKKK